MTVEMNLATLAGMLVELFQSAEYRYCNVVVLPGSGIVIRSIQVRVHHDQLAFQEETPNELFGPNQRGQKRSKLTAAGPLVLLTDTRLAVVSCCAIQEQSQASELRRTPRGPKYRCYFESPNSSSEILFPNDVCR